MSTRCTSMKPIVSRWCLSSVRLLRIGGLVGQKQDRRQEGDYDGQSEHYVAGFVESESAETKGLLNRTTESKEN